MSKEENKKNLDLIIDALIDRARSILKDGEDVEEFHGGEQVYSVKHGAYKHILAAFHGSDGKTEYYTFSDGTKANANEVQETEPQRDLTEEISQPVIGQPTNNKLLAKYNALKEKHPDTKILLRVGISTRRIKMMQKTCLRHLVLFLPKGMMMLIWLVSHTMHLIPIFQN